jgi:hypothetical protein
VTLYTLKKDVDVDADRDVDTGMGLGMDMGKHGTLFAPFSAPLSAHVTLATLAALAALVDYLPRRDINNKTTNKTATPSSAGFAQ